MMCAWSELLAILPLWLREERLGKEGLQEIRLRLGKPPELRYGSGSRWLQREVTREDLNFCVNTASRYSPWAAGTTAMGYLTVPGGHRLGICGTAVMKAGEMTGLRDVQMLCIRVAKDFPGIALNLSDRTGSILLIGPPGSGKTTLLRDLIRQMSEKQTVSVVDERQELFPVSQGKPCFLSGKSLDILSGCPKAQGIDRLIRAMGPQVIAVDEITTPGDCEALVQAAGCGVRLLATAHGSGASDLLRRPVYRRILAAHIFERVITLSPDKTWKEEEVPEWKENSWELC